MRMRDQTLCLVEAKEGFTYRVTSIGKDACLCQLHSLGFQEGARLQVIRRVSGGYLLVCRVDEVDIALRSKIAAAVQLLEECANAI